MRLARAGYYGGDPKKVREAPMADVISVIEYEQFIFESEIADYLLNDKD